MYFYFYNFIFCVYVEFVTVVSDGDRSPVFVWCICLRVARMLFRSKLTLYVVLAGCFIMHLVFQWLTIFRQYVGHPF